MRNIPYRILITTVNIFFPPVAVMMLTGLGHDTLVNSLLFLAGVLPSHVHGFYISCTYFHRRRKARKGRYPGDAKGMIASKNVLNGGLTSRECERRWLAENGGGSEKVKLKSRRNSRRPSRRSSRRSSLRESVEGKEVEGGIGKRVEMDAGEVRPQTKRIQTWRSEVVDADLDLMPALPPRPGVG
ncbi:hypothetical protein E2P81_ATG01064 [Venturia nashicola]|uniref:Uncharacterized protein n=1 Tax=Venturia nashicola TaxID=86259 RepID=A0A4Z1PB16_9PEZI|nr:hypothetical protein E6O75_ATG01085 [Venturia nashicola]TLD38521.1 hypothetical protein E2P81_ATG01064 [Venturia nashicola]